MESLEKELEAMLEIGRYLGPGLRYLLYYYGQLAITNDIGLICWPEGPKVLISTIKPQECKGGLGLERKEYLLARLYSLEDIRERQGRQARRRMIPAQVEICMKSRNWSNNGC